MSETSEKVLVFACAVLLIAALLGWRLFFDEHQRVCNVSAERGHALQDADYWKNRYETLSSEFEKFCKEKQEEARKRYEAANQTEKW